MVRRVVLALTVLLVLVSLGLPGRPALADSEDVQVSFNGQPVLFEVPPVIRDDRTFVPVRFVLERIEAKLEWNGVKRQVTIHYGEKTVILTIDSRDVLVDGRAVQIDVAPFIYKDRTMVPLRFISEEFGFQVNWEPATRTVGLVPPATAPTSSHTVVVDAPASVAVTADSFMVTVRAERWQQVSAAAITLTFDPTKAEFLGVVRGAVMSNGTQLPDTAPRAGRVLYVIANQGGTFSGDGVLFQVRFKPKATGDVNFVLGSGAEAGNGALSVLTSSPKFPLQYVQPVFVNGSTTITN